MDKSTILEIPNGWYTLLFLMLADLRPVLEKHNILEDFRFLQIKEKFGLLYCYTSKAPEEVELIIDKYKHMAGNICSHCGKPATYATYDYILPFCDDCWKDFARHEKGWWIKFKPYFETTKTINGKTVVENISFKAEWDRYLKIINR
jgi:hypothetical protein